MLLDMNAWVLEDRPRFLKSRSTWDILDPATNEVVGIAREERPQKRFVRLDDGNGRERPGCLGRILGIRWVPDHVSVYPGDDMPPLLTIQRGGRIFRPESWVSMADGRMVGTLATRMFPLGSIFRVLDGSGVQTGDVKRSDWRGRRFSFVDACGREVGTVRRVWGGLRRELLSGRRKHEVVVSPDAPRNHDLRAMLLATAILIDLAEKEEDAASTSSASTM